MVRGNDRNALSRNHWHFYDNHWNRTDFSTEKEYAHCYVDCGGSASAFDKSSLACSLSKNREINLVYLEMEKQGMGILTEGGSVCDKNQSFEPLSKSCPDRYGSHDFDFYGSLFQDDFKGWI